jgi:1,4-dihydroxy-2-naphthoate octaprenyltransferase
MVVVPSPAQWFAGARPRTLPAAVVPVVVGTAVAASQGDVVWWRAVAAAVVALALQVGTNYANDFSDGVRGTDTDRVGPLRLVASGTATATSVKRAALLSFAVAGVAGLALAAAAGWVLLVVGAASMAAGWLYTGGPRPYGYHGLGEVFVFVFFGLVATVGSAYVHLEEVTALAVVAAVPVGLWSVAMLVVNNLRDRPKDAVAGKRTLAVRMGDTATRRLYVADLAAAAAVIVVIGVGPDSIRRPWALLAILASPLALAPIRVVRSGAAGPALIPVLGATGRYQLVAGALLSVGIASG